MQELIAFAQSGELGRVKLARGLCYKPRGSIGKVKAPKQPPASVDYDLWLGPAAQQPVRRGRFHYDWHWQWPFGNGDVGQAGADMQSGSAAVWEAAEARRIISGPCRNIRGPTEP